MNWIERLKAAGIAQASREFRILEGQFSGAALEKALQRREAREPLSHIVGYRDFWKDRFIVGADVLDPRPDSELFIELATRHSARTILDLGCGSGALGLSTLREFPNARAVLADISPAALEIAKRNAVALGLMERTEFVQSNWFDNIDGQFDLILCNPPYIASDEMSELAPELSLEPRFALTDEADGLEHFRHISQNLTAFLKPSGTALFEHGFRQQEQVCKIFLDQGFECSKHKDLSNHPRIVEINVKT